MNHLKYVIFLFIVILLTSCSPKDTPVMAPQVEDIPAPAITPTPTVIVKSTIPFTVNESERIDDIVNTLCKTFNFKRADVIKEMESDEYNSFMMNPSAKSYKRFEGIPLPKEYVLEEGTSIKQILWSFINESENRYINLQKEVIDKNTLKPYEQLILASIVEKECLANRQEDEVVSVFLNRLNNKSKLKSCVTVEYALGFERPFLVSKDVKVDNPYNTYNVSGFPPTAISVPDDAALKAAIKSSSYKYYYFVYDYIDNNIEFSSNYSQHRKISTRIYNKFVKESKISPSRKIKKGVKLEITLHP